MTCCCRCFGSPQTRTSLSKLALEEASRGDAAGVGCDGLFSCLSLLEMGALDIALT